MEEPAPSEMVKGTEGQVGYRWILTDTERAHLSNMLDVDGKLDLHIMTLTSGHCMLTNGSL
jgi:hypothetical protein